MSNKDMNHDEEWLYESEGQDCFLTGSGEIASKSFARAYHEHMAEPLIRRIAELEAQLDLATRVYLDTEDQ